jgi:hypothetical protein
MFKRYTDGHHNDLQRTEMLGHYIWLGSHNCLGFHKKPCWFRRTMMNLLLGLKWEDAK